VETVNSGFSFEVWNLEFIWNLVLGIWNLCTLSAVKSWKSVKS
jgi:hypothetical protein